MRRVPLLFIAASLAFGCSDAPKPPGDQLTRLEGTVYRPAEAMRVDVYRAGEDIRGPPYTQLGPLAEDGGFSIELPPGDYVLVGRQRSSGEETGPVREGDLKTDPIPVTVRGGEPLALKLHAYRKSGNVKQPFGDAANWAAGIGGRVFDAEGKPVEGIRVHVYDHIQMSERPKFVSARTGPDGRWEIKLPEGGTYYLCARDKYGGPPRVGELYGRYDQGTVDPSAVIVEEGKLLEGVDITVHKVW